MRNRNAGIHLVLLCALPLAAQSDKARLATVEGVVTNSETGAPVPHAQVILNGRYAASASLDGKFSIDLIPEGSWRLAGYRAGFVSARGLNSVTLKAGETKADVEIKLTPTGAILGTVTDADGEPVEGASVEAVGSGRAHEFRETDEQGRFRLGGLAPGRYAVKATPDSRWHGRPEIRSDGTVEVHNAATYYPGALTEKAAGTVLVLPSIEFTGADIRLVRVPFARVSGRVVGMPQGVRNATLSAYQGRMGVETEVRPDGSFEMWRLDPGKYDLTAEWEIPNGEQVETAAAEIEVAGSAIDDVELRVIADSDIAGRIEFEDDQARQMFEEAGKAQQGPKLELFQLGAQPGIPESPRFKRDGTFRLENIAPAKYWLCFSDPRLYVKSMRMGPTAIDRAVLDLRNGSGGADLTLVLSAATGSITGIPAGSAVVLTDAGEETGFQAREATVQPDGTYTFANLPPGNYRLVAVAEPDPAIDDNYVLGYGDLMETVEVKAGEKATKDLKLRTP